MSGLASFSSPLAPIIERFLTLMQALGRGYRSETRVLAHLDRFLAGAGPNGADLTAETFEAWSRTLLHLRSGVRRNRMRIVRKLCLYRRRSEPQCFVPDLALFPPPHRPVRPYLFAEAEVARLLAAADALEPAPSSPLRPSVLRLGVVLLYTAGLRRGELLGCRLGDVDPLERTLWVRPSKFHKSRLLPLSASAFAEVERYLSARRAAAFPTSADTPLLSHRRTDARGYTGTGFTQGLRVLLRATDIRKPDGKLPRVHDFRHSFAVRVLLRWYRAGIDVRAKLPLLATYMGHVSIASTEYYLPFAEELAAAAGERFERYAGTLIVPERTRAGGAP